jgi:hypothetical protein
MTRRGNRIVIVINAYTPFGKGQTTNTMNTEAIERIRGYCCEVTQVQWDELVRVADEVGVKVFNPNWSTCNGKMVVSVHGLDNDIVKDPVNVQNKPVIPFPDFLAKLRGEEQWEPKAGEMVEVSHQGITWFEREFIGHSRGKYVGWTSDGETHAWAKCRKARPTVTRTEAEQLLNKRIID